MRILAVKTECHLIGVCLAGDLRARVEQALNDRRSRIRRIMRCQPRRAAEAGLVAGDVVEILDAARQTPRAGHAPRPRLQRGCGGRMRRHCRDRESLPCAHCTARTGGATTCANISASLHCARLYRMPSDHRPVARLHRAQHRAHAGGLHDLRQVLRRLPDDALFGPADRQNRRRSRRRRTRHSARQRQARRRRWSGRACVRNRRTAYRRVRKT